MGVSAEKVGADAAAQVTAYLASEGAVCEHLADQLLLPMAIGGGGSFTTGTVTEHTRTNMHVIAKFLRTSFRVEENANQSRIIVGEPRSSELLAVNATLLEGEEH
jgi:RNA 3'-terminal phosphate cyclase (ATP)